MLLTSRNDKGQCLLAFVGCCQECKSAYFLALRSCTSLMTSSATFFGHGA